MMMLRKKSRPVQKKDQGRGLLMQDSAMDSTVTRARSTSFFGLPGLFVGFSSKNIADSDPSRSPKSPLDYKVFSNLGNPFARSPRSPAGLDSPRRSWDCNRIGLGLVDSLTDETRSSGMVSGFSESRNIVFGSHLRINIPSPGSRDVRTSEYVPETSPKSLPKNYVISSQSMVGSPGFQSACPEPMVGSGVFTQVAHRGNEKTQFSSTDAGKPSLQLNGFISLNPKSSSGELSLESKEFQLGASSLVGGINGSSKLLGSLPISLGSCHGFVGSLSASDIELSEDYTRIITHGPNPRTTHIFGDCILESDTSELPYPLPSPADDFLNLCTSCKELGEGQDIGMCRREKTLFSCNMQEILINMEMDKSLISTPTSTCAEEIFLTDPVD